MKFRITVLPLPVIPPLPDLTVCINALTTVNLIPPAPNVGFTWTNSNTSIGLAAAGTGSPISFFATLPGNSPETATVTIGTVYTDIGLACADNDPPTFNITVNPRPLADPLPNIVACPNEPISVGFTGNDPSHTYTWTNSNPSTGLDASGTGNISFTTADVPALSVSNISVTPIDVYGCPGPPQIFKITINPYPVLNPISDLEFCAGAPAQVFFGGTPGTTYEWTNSNTAIGLAASGMGNTSFTAAAVSALETATVTVTPKKNGCTGEALSFNLTIKPVPVASDPADMAVCGGDSIHINFSSTQPAHFNWTNSNPNIGLPASGNGHIAFAAPTVATIHTANLTVRPTGQNGCTGLPQNFAITINPTPILPPQPNLMFCDNTQANVNFGVPSGVSVFWANSNPQIGLQASGNGDIGFISADTDTLQTASITAFANIGTCPSAPIQFNINVGPTPLSQISGKNQLCAGDTLQLTASGGATYAWNTGASTPNLILTSTQSATYTVTVTAIGGCTSVVSATVQVSPMPNPAIAGPANVCKGQTANLVASGGSTYLWNSGQNAAILNLIPTQTSTYTVTVSTTNGCSATASMLVAVNSLDTTRLFSNTCQPGQAGVFMQHLSNRWGCDSTVVRTVKLLPSHALEVFETSCNPASVGVFTQTFSNSFGCDSIVTRHVSFALSDTTRLFSNTCDATQAGLFVQSLTTSEGCDSVVIRSVGLQPSHHFTRHQTTCDPALAGTSTQVFQNQHGCDSTVVTTITLLPSSAIAVVSTTCNPAAAGTFTQILSNQHGCDSIVSTLIVFDANAQDSTFLQKNTCDPTQAGTVFSPLLGSDGCDSIVVTTTVLRPLNSVSLQKTTCDPALAGVVVQVFQNQFGCDSIVTTTTTLLPKSATAIQKTTCDPTLAGVVVQVFQNQHGCDSTVTTTTALLPSHMKFVQSSTCNPAATGIFTQVFPNQYGCDSTVITQITLDVNARDSTFLQKSTCDPTQAGVDVVSHTGSDGCDSLVFTVTVLYPSNDVLVQKSTCDPALAGTFSHVFQNQYGCDSVVTTTTALLPSNTTNIARTTCDPALAGTNTQIYPNQYGCDSTVITTTALLPSSTTFVQNSTCNPVFAGVLTFALQNQHGCDSTVTVQTLFDPNARDSTFLTKTTCDPAQVGIVSLPFIGSDGCDSLVIERTLLLPESQSFVQKTTCDPALLGTFSEVFTAFNGCDSTVVTLVTLQKPDSTLLRYETCDPDFVGTIVRKLLNKDGCDSIVQEITSLLPPPTGQIAALDSTMLSGDSLLLTVSLDRPIDTVIWSPSSHIWPVSLTQALAFPERTTQYTAHIFDTNGCATEATFRIHVERDRNIWIPNVIRPQSDQNGGFTVYGDAGVERVELLRVFDRWGNLAFERRDFIHSNPDLGWQGDYPKGKPAHAGVYVYYAIIRLTDDRKLTFAGDVTVAP